MNQTALEAVRAAVGDRYDIDHAIGSGGMGTVYHARDRRNGQVVALKVLRPEVASVVSRERFQREVDIASKLDHPGLLRLLDSGEVDDMLFYTMPYVEGRTLGQRLAAEGPMGIEEAVNLGAQVAEALAYAHERGIVHRDIKPANLLLSEGRILVADFGIAQLMHPDVSRKLTSSGIAVGTPAYMSPEQVARDRIDGRSDQYSLACVIYEMLAGDPPFSASELRVILARHALDPVPSLVTVRPSVPVALERVLLRALAKQPADRWPTSAAFGEALREALTAPSESSSGSWRSRAPWLVGMVVVAAVGVAAVLLGNPGAELDEDRVAVVPFLITGSPSELVSSERVTEAVRARLHGIGDWTAVAATSRASGIDLSRARKTGRRLGAGYALAGSVFANGEKLEISAALTSVADGREVARVDRLTTTIDELLAGLDRAVLTLAAMVVDEPRFRIAGLVQRPPDAVKEYLSGATLVHHGRYREAAAALQRALLADTTFAVAGLMAYRVNRWTGDYPAQGRGYLVARENLHQLSGPDAMVFNATAGPRAPLPSSYAEWLRAWSRVTDSLPDSREAALSLSEMLRDWGAATGNTAAHQQSANLLRRIIRADSSFAPAAEGLLDLASTLSDSAEVRRIEQVYRRRSPFADRRAYYAWRVASALGDTVHKANTDSLIGSATTDELRRMIAQAQLDGSVLNDAVSAVNELRRRARTPLESWAATLADRELAHNTGRIREAREWPSPSPFRVPIEALFQVVQTLYWDGDSTIAARMVRERIPVAEGPPPQRSAQDPRYMDVCTVGLWRALERDWSRVKRAASRLAQATGTEVSGSLQYIPVCQATLSALVEAETGGPAASAELARLDSLAASYPPTNAYIMFAANMTIARLKEAQNDLASALAAVRRRSFASDYGAVGLSTFLREEGRLAERTNDLAAARAAYARYLALRRTPDPQLEAEVGRIRTALQSMVDRDNPGARSVPRR